MKLVDQNFILANRNRNGWCRAYHLNARSAFSREGCAQQSKSNRQNKDSPRETKRNPNRFFHVERSVAKPCLLGILAEYAASTGQYGCCRHNAFPKQETPHRMFPHLVLVFRLPE